MFHIHRTWRMALAPLFPAITLPHLPIPLFLLVSLAQASSLSGGVCRSSWCVSRSAAWCCTVMDAVAKRAAGHTHTHVCTHRHTHTGKRKVFPETHYSFPSLPYCLCLSENRSRWRKICAVVSLWSSIQAPLKSFQRDDQ